jgi:pimeloyl-ACP methyl ester carboxylesterase
MTMSQAQLEVPGGTIAFDDTGGSGPLVVCVPGLGDVRALYRFLTPALVAAGQRVVTMDIRGHGDSSTGWPEYTADAIGRDIVALLRHLDAGAGGAAVVVGESLAAGSALWAATEAPELVAATVLCGPVVRDVPLGFVASLGVKLVARSPGLWVAFYGSLYKSRKPDDFPAYKSQLKANLGEPGRMDALRGYLAASKVECEKRIDAVRCPSLVVMGTADPDFKDATAEARMLSGRLGGEPLLVAGAGHYPQTERPDVVVPAIVAFLAKVRSA